MTQTQTQMEAFRREVRIDIAHFDLAAMNGPQTPGENDEGAQSDNEKEKQQELPELPDPVEVGEDG
ncbi:hypothetical protein [Paraburkholderia sp. J41]|uniref:hypothetical protein n=1 Tax=Paraburkholderia sp. J41 TaxID=2805433 RepID=UPI002AC32F44|nr:hypothetical protein [Paraburkholderia sp. J41]